MIKPIVQRMAIYPLSIPLCHKVTDAAGLRGIADPVVVGLELAGGAIGFGEALARRHVTGETADTTVTALRDVYSGLLTAFHPASFPEALEFIEGLALRHGNGSVTPAARAGVELALLDASMRHFHRGMDDVTNWMGMPGFGSPGSRGNLRYGGTLAAEDLDRTMHLLRRLYWRGVRDFKLKVGMAGDRERLAEVARYLKRPLARGAVTLRVDANGAWTKDGAIDWLYDGLKHQVAAVEQPLRRGEEDQLPVLCDIFDVAFVHDESLLTIEDAKRLVSLGVAGGFNIRISKCGGLMPSLRLAAYARRNHVPVHLGATAGETSILTAAGVRFLDVCPGLAWAEGALGSHVLSEDVMDRGLRLGYGGRPPVFKSDGLVPEVNQDRLVRLCEDQPIYIHL